MLAEHRIDNANEGLVAVEQSVASGQEIAFQPPFALVLAEHRVEYPAGRRQELVVVEPLGVPLAIGNLEHGAKQIRKCLIGSEDPKIAGVQFDDVLEELAEDKRVLAIDGAG